MSKYTPGPWRASIAGNDEEIHIYDRADGIVWAVIKPPNNEIDVANAHLMATSPEMYEVLEKALGMLEDFNIKNPNKKAENLMADIMTVLEKARGYNL